eukprot:gene7352-8134_t
MAREGNGAPALCIEGEHSCTSSAVQYLSLPAMAEPESPISISPVLNALLNDQHVPLEEVLNRYFSPEYRQRTNGHWDNREEFLAHARKLREVVASAHVDVLDELHDGNRYADRHVVHVVKRDGSTVVQEVYLFGQVDESGRFVRVEETTMMLEGAEADRSIGSAK